METVTHHEASEIYRISIYPKMLLAIIQRNFPNLSRIFSVTALVLCSLWATSDRPTFLGIPSTSGRRLFPWHPILMVSVFFVSIAFAVTSWHYHVLPYWRHVIWQHIALAGLAAGLYIVFSEKNRPPLTSLHSWIGMLTASVFLFSLVGQYYRQLRKACDQNYSLQSFVNTETFFALHRFAGGAVLVLATLSIATGVMNVLGRETCYYDLHSTRDAMDASARYNAVPLGCRLANWMGLSVVFSATFAVAGILAKTVICIPPGITTDGTTRVHTVSPSTPHSTHQQQHVSLSSPKQSDGEDPEAPTTSTTSRYYQSMPGDSAGSSVNISKQQISFDEESQMGKSSVA